ncbi:MAG: carboxypeptidase-like regulatory domain-containing protein [Rubinisphaera brasiliensis]|uniref:carboxypeptidase-like regulatory domain-containing protein n=1 Tax=Rubinisphaera brasiliensis TaxID=119 RepID=UPI00391A5468
MTKYHCQLLCGLLFSLLILPGCGGGDGPEMGTVSGTVTLDGDPLPNVQVLFNPGTARPSEAVTNESGQYELQYTPDIEGAVVGTHQVFISSRHELDDEGNPVSQEEAVPAKYNTESTLSEEVTSGHNEINFDLES